MLNFVSLYGPLGLVILHSHGVQQNRTPVHEDSWVLLQAVGLTVMCFQLIKYSLNDICYDKLI